MVLVLRDGDPDRYQRAVVHSVARDAIASLIHCSVASGSSSPLAAGSGETLGRITSAARAPGGCTVRRALRDYARFDQWTSVARWSSLPNGMRGA